MTVYKTKLTCPKCGKNLMKTHKTNSWNNVSTPYLFCKVCSYKIEPNTKEEQDIFDNLLLSMED